MPSERTRRIAAHGDARHSPFTALNRSVKISSIGGRSVMPPSSASASEASSHWRSIFAAVGRAREHECRIPCSITLVVLLAGELAHEVDARRRGSSSCRRSPCRSRAACPRSPWDCSSISACVATHTSGRVGSHFLAEVDERAALAREDQPERQRRIEHGRFDLPRLERRDQRRRADRNGLDLHARAVCGPEGIEVGGGALGGDADLLAGEILERLDTASLPSRRCASRSASPSRCRRSFP